MCRRDDVGTAEPVPGAHSIIWDSDSGAERRAYDDRMTVADRCPGVLRPHQAEDGLLIRLRIPGGQTTGTVLAALADLAGRYGHPELQITSRAGLQLRGLPDPVPPTLIDDLGRLGLLPSPAHDRVRNVVTSPLTGLSGPDGVDLRPMTTELDRRLIAEPALAELPGRFLFALDDGSGDVTELPFDLGFRAVSLTRGHVLIGSRRHRIPVANREAVGVLLGLARTFVRDRAAQPGRVWHVRDLPGWAAAQASETVEQLPMPPREPPLGVVAGAASVHVPLGLLTAEQTTTVAASAGRGPVVVSPWRGLIIPGAGNRLSDLLAVGLVADPRSAWTRVTACIGAPYCSRTRLDTRAAALDLVRAGGSDRVHVSGCERRCGAPVTPHRELVAP